MLIDFHTHIFPDDVCENREKYFKDRGFKNLYESPRSRLIRGTDLVDYMEENGLNHAVAMGFPWEDEEICETHNTFLAEVSKKSGGRIISFGIPHVGADVDVAILTLKESGITGIGEIAFYEEGHNGGNLEYLEEIFRSAVKYSMPVCLHLNEPVGHNYPGKYDPSFKKIYSLIERFPDLKLVLSHWGGGIFIYELMPEVKRAFKNIYYDTAASPFLYDSNIYRIAEEIVGDKILFGSDYPLLGIKRYSGEISDSFANAGKVSRVMGDNAARFLEV